MKVSEQLEKDFYPTDKEIPHGYISGVYDTFFPDIRENAKLVLEVGVKGGGSIILWKDYFPNATIIGVDIEHCKQFSKPHHQDRVVEIVGNAYSKIILDCVPANLDVAIDDGSHKLDDIKFFVNNYYSKVKDGGYLFVEDIPHLEWIEEIIGNNEYDYEIFDTREGLKSSDNILLMIRK